MRKLPLLLISALFALSGCHDSRTAIEALTKTQPAVTYRIEADNRALWLAAAHVLTLNHIGVAEPNIDNTALPLLQLNENINENIDSLVADGSAGAYEVVYHLTYRWNNEKARSITDSRVVSHDENRYHAGGAQRRQIVNGLRESALTQMLHTIRAN